MALPMASAAPMGSLEPTWGERFLLARRRAKMKLDDAALKVSTVTPASYGMLNRLEARDAPPTDRRQRTVAFVALLAYGFNPEAFGLTRADLPAAVDEGRLRSLLAAAAASPTMGHAVGQLLNFPGQRVRQRKLAPRQLDAHFQCAVNS